MKPVLEARNVCHSFGGVCAVDDISISVDEGEIFGIIGPNGSGKSTFFNILTGIYAPKSGRFFYRGKDITGLPAHVIVQHGISRTFQNLRTFGSLTLRENVMLGMHNKLSVNVFDALFRSRKYKGEEKMALEKADELLGLVGLSHIAGKFACNLSYGQQKRLELARVLASQSDILLLDEPTAGIPQGDADELINLLRHIRDTRNISILIIEHNMRTMTSLVDRMMAMDRGKKITEGCPEEVLNSSAVIHAYLGEE